MSRVGKKDAERGSSKDTDQGKNIVIKRTDLSTFDDSFSFLKEKFDAEMKKVDEEMNKFSVDLVALYGQMATAKDTAPTWDALANSPLIEGDGEDKMLKLQFDLTQFDPAEIKVKVFDNVLTVSAVHEEKTDNSEARREFRREFLLPRGTNPDTVVSTLSRDGVLTVQAPLPKLEAEEADSDKVLSKSPQDAKAPASKKDSKSAAQALPKADDTKAGSPAAGITPPSPMSAVSPASPNTPRKISTISSKTRKP